MNEDTVIQLVVGAVELALKVGLPLLLGEPLQEGLGVHPPSISVGICE